MIKNFAGGLAAATAAALAAAVPSIAGSSTWKYLLGAIGLALFVRAGIGRRL